MVKIGNLSSSEGLQCRPILPASEMKRTTNYLGHLQLETFGLVERRMVMENGPGLTDQTGNIIIGMMVSQMGLKRVKGVSTI